METIMLSPHLCLKMAQGKISLKPPPPRRDWKQEEFAAWKNSLTSGDKVHIWSSELP
ncbi:rCG59514, isoform CRA_b [Rattus norvegicus]|uniref:RCG59514, isoform CRA_b n=1 Tax=Rattus norvegicus TaxID=10116 RepID=A6HRU5_RAT|nr:rCG59514, isoform CRA_b [Rattus norvegicus]